MRNIRYDLESICRYTFHIMRHSFTAEAFIKFGRYIDACMILGFNETDPEPQSRGSMRLPSASMRGGAAARQVDSEGELSVIQHALQIIVSDHGIALLPTNTSTRRLNDRSNSVSLFPHHDSGTWGCQYHGGYRWLSAALVAVAIHYPRHYG